MRLLVSLPQQWGLVPGRLLELRGDMQPRKMATQAVDTAGQNAAYRLACGIELLDSSSFSCYTINGDSHSIIIGTVPGLDSDMAIFFSADSWNGGHDA